MSGLQKALSSRHPNSVTSLVHAASVSESVQLRKLEQDEQIRALVTERERSDALYETRLRSLRQELEKAKVFYEAKLSAAQNTGGRELHTEDRAPTKTR